MLSSITHCKLTVVPLPTNRLPCMIQQCTLRMFTKPSMATILSQKTPLLRVISLRPTPLPRILHKNITHVSRPLSDIRIIASLNRRAIMNGAIYAYSPAFPRGEQWYTLPESVQFRRWTRDPTNRNHYTTVSVGRNTLQWYSGNPGTSLSLILITS